ncbi:MAG: SDR family oxidoreductase [Methyloceanibacter sp.]|jgi:3-oxoacyl-[acyl-carrier protein] reductase
MEAVKTIIITGGGGHLGRSVARWWAKPGTHLVLVDKDTVRLEKCRADLAACGANLTTIATDVTVPNDLKAAIGSLFESLWSSPPSLVLAHGLAGKGADSRSQRLGELDHARWQAVLDANLTSVVFTIQGFLPLMKKAGGGRIVLVSSTAGLSASQTAALSYSVAKAAVAALPRLLALELALSNVLINAVAPGKFVNPDWPDEPPKVKRYETSVPLRRLASADEVAALIGFLSSGANTYVTGQTICQDGGRLSALPMVD